jgi:hypothetical protein
MVWKGFFLCLFLCSCVMMMWALRVIGFLLIVVRRVVWSVCFV